MQSAWSRVKNGQTAVVFFIVFPSCFNSSTWVIISQNSCGLEKSQTLHEALNDGLR
jgi:hypothetical protein